MNIPALRLLFEYDPETGILTRNSTGRPCGSPHGKGYLRVNAGVHGMIYAHRLAFALHHGYLPAVVDHMDRNRLNNRIENLRACVQAENCCNRVKQLEGASSQHKGVHFEKQTQKWRALIKTNGRKISLGRFETEEQAARAYDEAAEKYHKQFGVKNNV